MRLTAALRSGPLAVRSFRLLAGGQFTSTIGDYCYAVALPWLVLSNHGSAILLGTVLACYGVPRMVFIPAGGVLADKIGPRTVMLMADGIKRANSADPAKVRDALAATRNFPMLEGNLQDFNSLHEIIMPISVNIVKDGKFKSVGQIMDLAAFAPPEK